MVQFPNKTRIVFYNCGGHSNFFNFINNEFNEFSIACIAEHWMEKEPILHECLTKKNTIFSFLGQHEKGIGEELVERFIYFVLKIFKPK